MKRVTHKKSSIMTIGLLALAVLGYIVAAVGLQSVDAADLRHFDPGNIISDAVMRDKNSMNEQQIQNFLNWKNPCNNTNIQLARNYPHLHYNIRDGKFVCMAQESFNGESAARIIYQAAQDYHINPKVLIVLLEKEQGLITDTWPNHVQYRAATGFGCPDTADCDARYYGLKNQIRLAANLFDTVLKGGWSNYPVGNNYIRYSPKAECGGSVVNIKNRATSALYRYTPYQPNQSALNAGYGTGDACGAYGNRNFWLFFNDWFGTTRSWEDMATPSNVDLPSNTDFVIRNSHNFALDVKESNTSNGATIFSWMTTGNINQKFRLEKTHNNLYIIRSALNTNKVIDLYNSNTANTTKIQLWDYHGGCNQKWSILKKPNNTYHIVSACNSAKALDLNPVNQRATQPVIFDKHNGPVQEWLLEEHRAFVEKNTPARLSQDKYYAITNSSGKVASWAGGAVSISDKSAAFSQAFRVRNVGDDMYKIIHGNRALTLKNAAVTNGNSVSFEYHNDGCGQQWYINKKPNGKHTIVSACDVRYALDVNPGDKNGSLLLLYPYHGLAVQELTFIEVAAPRQVDELDGKLTSIRNSHNFALDVKESNTSNGATIFSWMTTGNINQKFRLEKTHNNLYIIRSALNTNKVIDLYNSNTANTTKIQLWDYHGGCNQKWSILKKPNNTYHIVSACNSAKALDLNPVNQRATQPVIFDKHNGPVQEWLL